MTTIAWDGMTLAADTQTTEDNIIVSNSRIKIFEPKYPKRWGISALHESNIKAVAICGDTGAESELINALSSLLSSTTILDSIYSYAAIAVCGENEAYYINKPEGEKRALISFSNEKMAIGTGGTIALSAMKCGKSAFDAVEIAKDLDIYTGGDVIAYSLRDEGAYNAPTINEKDRYLNQYSNYMGYKKGI